MPVMDGYQCATAIREIQPSSQALSILGVSGNSGTLLVRKCKLAGMDDMLTKPVSLELLIDVVSNVLKTN